MADLIYFGSSAVWVRLSQGRATFAVSSSFYTTSSFTYDAGFDDAGKPRLTCDVNGDGFSDIIGIKADGTVNVMLSDGTSFGSSTVWYTGVGSDQGYQTQKTHPRLCGDVDGDGRADLIYASSSGLNAALSDTTSSSFIFASSWGIADFAYNQYYDSDQNPRLVGDVDGDGRDDIVGFDDSGDVRVRLSTGSGFGEASIWASGYTYANGFQSNDLYPRHLADVDGDGKADLVIFAYYSTEVRYSTGSNFEAAQWLTDTFSGQEGWTGPEWPRVIGDIDGDGRADAVGFGPGNMITLFTDHRTDMR